MRDRFAGFNPNYRLTTGDTVLLQLWGAVEFQGSLTVDPQGNIFIPQVGPVQVRGVANSELMPVVERAVKSVYRENVRVYANLDESQPVNIFVTGYVESPGLYSGLSSDSMLSYLDRAGGIDPQRGSYLDVRLVRQGAILENVNLYDFLLFGQIPQRQLQEGDTLIVGPRQHVVEFGGLVENPRQIEFTRQRIALSDALRLARPMPSATHVLIQRNSRVEQLSEYIPLSVADNTQLNPGDVVTLEADKSLATIIVQLEGEHRGRDQYVMPYGSSLGDLLQQIEPGPQSNLEAVQLFRKEVAERQKQMLNASLENLQMSVLTAPSATNEEASLRTQEAEMVLQFIDRARDIEPQGQVVLANAPDMNSIILQDEDRIRVPSLSQLVTLYGEVMLPTALLHNDSSGLKDYINQAGGLSRKADKSRIVVRSPDGSIELARLGGLFRSTTNVDIAPGDEIMVLPEVDFKTLQFTKDIVQILYQSAIAAGVVLAL
ncbi:polysaccharide biosynthesis/export family protein [Saccharospirillum sp.]|uniref:polysaccharide biosynthesis/export family protein n=1 Tax=Saccharospirillum sp. TaxID=2033801 RepID=UPI0034A0569E